MGQPAGITQKEVEARSRSRDFAIGTARYVCACLIDDALSDEAELVRKLMRVYQLSAVEAQAAVHEMRAVRNRIDRDGGWT